MAEYIQRGKGREKETKIGGPMLWETPSEISTLGCHEESRREGYLKKRSYFHQ